MVPGYSYTISSGTSTNENVTVNANVTVVPAIVLAPYEAATIIARLGDAVERLRHKERSGFLGVRTWNLIQGRLWSPQRMVPWLSSTLRATCELSYCEPPEMQHVCGVYAYRFDAIERGERSLWLPRDSTWAVGIVSVFGKVIEHEHGWRGEAARVREVWTWNDSLDVGRYPGVTLHRLGW